MRLIPHIRFWQCALVIFMAASVCACHTRKNSDDNPDADKSQILDSIPQGSFSLKGKIGDFKIGMKIKIDAQDVTGAYFYYSQLEKKVFLTLNGKIDENGNMQLDEFAPEGEKTGSFKGKFNGSEYTGTFKNFDSGKSYKFALSVETGAVEDVPQSLNEKAGKAMVEKLNEYTRKKIPCKYFILDVMDDDLPELWVRTGYNDSDYVLHVFAYSEEKGLTEVYNEEAGHTRYFEGFYDVDAVKMVGDKVIYYTITYDNEEDALGVVVDIDMEADEEEDDDDGGIILPDGDELIFIDGDYVQPILTYLELDLKTL